LTPSRLYLGSTEITRAYLGATEVYSSGGGGGPVLWTPAQIATAVWLDAADASTIVLNGSNVSQWTDKSGNGAHATQATAANQPAYEATGLNGLPVLTFPGGDFMTFSSAIANYRSVAIVYSQTDTRNYSTFLGSLVGSNSAAFHGDDGSPQHVFHPSFTAPETRNGINRHNGTSIGDGTTTLRPATPVFSLHIPTAEQPSRGLTNLGSDRASAAGRSITGIIAEVIIDNVAWDQATYETVEGYLAWKWGLQANLPGGHPYKSAAPTV
jgi:hypothetical protein